MKLKEQLSELLAQALTEENMSQAALCREMGISTKHLNQMLNGQAGSLAMFDYAAHVLNRKFVIEMEFLPDDD